MKAAARKASFPSINRKIRLCSAKRSRLTRLALDWRSTSEYASPVAATQRCFKRSGPRYETHIDSMRVSEVDVSQRVPTTWSTLAV